METAYQNAISFAKNHYENFPVASYFIKKNLRKHVAIVYQFARQADDIADEGDLLDDERIKQLNDYENALTDSLNNRFENKFWEALKNTIDTFNLSIENFYNLLNAFKQDISKNRYTDFEDLLNYCRQSANPVGRIILELHNIKDENALEYSDNICTALQLTNFYQDVSVDIKKGRIYIPQNELVEFGVDELIFEKNEINTNFTRLMKFQVDRTEKLFTNGRNLLKYLPLLLKLEILLTIKGGEAILNKIIKNNYDVLNVRPSLTKFDFVKSIVSPN
ncbi:MAG: squalene synthase HpnC [Ignavibacteriae bacterium]|nr:squalene synthase HpnC [Ignavibacteriota bacterium]